jgi:hypothetical protein
MLRTDRSGFALPMSILIIGFLTAGIMAAHASIDGERRIVRNAVNQVDAYALAEAGLNRALANKSNGPATATYTLPGGQAVVNITLVRPAVGATPAMYLVRSEGRPTSGAMDRQGRHIVSTFAFWEIGTMTVKSAWSTLSGMHYNGAAGVIDGNDNCGQQAALPGVMVPSGTYTYTSLDKQPRGDPPVEQSKTQAQLANEIGIDWNAIVNEGAITPDYVIGPGDPWPTNAFNDPNAWPVIHVKKGFTNMHTLNSNGRGTLIVDGNLEIRGDTQWRGIILTGGNLIADGNNNVLGATVTSLNVTLGMTVPEVEVLNGQKTYAYDSCNVAAAAAKFSTLRALPNSWADTWQYSAPVN